MVWKSAVITRSSCEDVPPPMQSLHWVLLDVLWQVIGECEH